MLPYLQKKARRPLIIAISFLVLFSCSGGNMEEQRLTFPKIQDVSVASWEKLAKNRIFFGHQSVGFNIMDGVLDVIKENSQIELNVIETKNPADFAAPAFGHSRVGKNHDPKSKIDEFASIIRGGIGDQTDIAFFKFCFVDIESSSDIETIFSDYKNMMSNLKKDYPNTTFIHATVPLIRTLASNFKIRIKELLGMNIGFFDKRHNVARNEFNELIRNEFEGKEPIFDLAKFESTHPDGRRETFMKDGKTYYSLVADYSPDAGHLNELGRKKIAEQLLILLANLN